MTRLKAVVLLVVSGLSMLLAFMVLLMNMERDWTLRFFMQDIVFSRAVWMLLNAGAGLGLYFVFRRLLPSGLRALRATKDAEQMRQVRKLAEQSRNQQQDRT